MTDPLVRAADIAELAGVSRAAVTQWRKRHHDFPAPAASSSGRSPLFNRAEVEAWLTAHGKIGAPSPVVKSVRDVADSIGDRLRGGGPSNIPDIVGAALVTEFLLRGPAEGLVLHDSPASQRPTPSYTTLQGLSADQALEAISDLARVPRFQRALEPFTMVPYPHGLAELAVTIAELAAHIPAEGLLEVYDSVLAKVRLPSDPTDVVDLINDLIDKSAPPSEGASVVDPAVGIGKNLLEVGRRHPHAHLVGVDIDPSVLATLERRAILAQRYVDLRTGNSLGADPAEGLLADVVVMTPPWGLRELGDDMDPNDARWAFGRPAPRSDGVWLQQAIAHLDDGGRAFVITPANELFRTGPTESLRHELVRQGAVEAVIALPPGAFTPYAAIDTAIWILARPGQTADPDRVLFTRMADADGRNRWTPSSADAVVATYAQWRATGQIDDDMNSTVVSARDLLEPQATLLPETWIQRRDAASPQQLVDEIDALVRETLPDEEIGRFRLSSASLVRRIRITDLPGVTIHRGRLVEHSEEHPGGIDDVPVVNPRSLLASATSGTMVPEKFVHRDEANLLTEAGDIIVSALVSPGKAAAARIDVEGWAVSTGCFVVRVDESTSGAPDPDYLTACINASVGRQPVSRGFIRVMPSRLEATVVPRPDQDSIARSLRAAQQARREAAARLASIERLCEAIESAVGTGGIAVDD